MMRRWVRRDGHVVASSHRCAGEATVGRDFQGFAVPGQADSVDPGKLSDRPDELGDSEKLSNVAAESAFAVDGFSPSHVQLFAAVWRGNRTFPDRPSIERMPA